MPTIDDVAPDRSTYLPNQEAHVRVRLTNSEPEPLTGTLTLRLSHLDECVEQLERQVELQPNSTLDVAFALVPPPVPLRGYGLDATLYGHGGNVLADASGALDVLEHWSQAPRYGFLSDFAPGQTHAEIQARGESLCRYHLNAVQFYDWMWRHYKLLPPVVQEEEFTDAMGRHLSLRSVRLAIDEVQARGGAALGYGAVYGAEPEFALQHPDLLLYDEDGQPVSLDKLFYIMNIAPDSPWVPLIVEEFAEAVRVMDFDGIHLDQYGFPRTALTAAGERVDLSEHFPPLIDAAKAAVAAARPGAGVIFNAVENWPIETVAPTSQDAVYIEVWPPYTSYNDLRSLIKEGRRLSGRTGRADDHTGGKQVILAAYLSPFANATEETLPEAEAAALLSTATIYASGGSHLLLGERDGVLCDPYYPRYATLRPAFTETMRAYYDFLVRYEELLVAPDLQDWEWQAASKGAPELTLVAPESAAEGGALAGIEAGEDIPVSAVAEAGKVWALMRCKSGYLILHLVNLADQRDVAWNAPRTPPRDLGKLELTVPVGGLPALSKALLLTPDANLGRPVPLAWTQEGSVARFSLPACHRWSVVVCELSRS